jgi:hypothetical protein
MEQELEALEQNQGPTQQQQQKEQELQQREQAVAQAETQAKDEMHRMELSRKDSERASDKLAAEKALFDLEKKYVEDVRRMQEQFTNEVDQIAQKLLGEAEGAVRGVIQESQPGAQSNVAAL